ncbi:MAG: nicotinate (nicotinamide) nucleotide adenylyltransferase [Christensenellaceae bacterium]|nr:nicotinate (nicotinamide) nucleotide adenylyltransferase [Christensenellaceae bacterium]
MSAKKVGIMGGSFDPIHDRHIELAKAALKEYKLDNIIFIPSGKPPHKDGLSASAGERMQMIRLAIADYKEFSLSNIEITRSGKSYTVDTMLQLKKENPNVDYYYIIGEDSLNNLENWYKPLELFKLCNFIVAKRDNNAETNKSLMEFSNMGAKFFMLNLSPINISSTQIRDDLKNNYFSKDIAIPVFEYIFDMGLYGIIPINEKYRDYIIKLSTMLTDKRLAHSLAVAFTAKNLAEKHKINKDLTTTAALLHDCAKCMSLRTLQQIAGDNNLYFDPVTYNTSLLHAPIGAQLAKSVFGVDDERVFSAISYHTTGMPGMNALDMIVFLADKIEPTRISYPNLEEIRRLAETDLKKAIKLSIKSTGAYLKISGKKVHINTARLLEWLKK